MHKSRLAAMVIECKVDEIEEANQFWESALGYPCVRSRESWNDRYSSLDCPKDQPQVLIQKVDHESRAHLDIETDNIKAEVERLILLGAKVVQEFDRWVVMEAPTGHRFCVVNPERDDFDESDHVNTWQQK